MILYKTHEEIEVMKEGGAILKEVMKEVVATVRSGVTTSSLDTYAEELIRKAGAEPSFQKVPGYMWTTCMPVNEQAVHTPPSQYVLKKGDVLTIDMGVYVKGFHTDHATTIIVDNEEDAKKKEFLRVGYETLEAALPQFQEGEHLGTIAHFIEKEITKHGYHILKDLTGHGIGKGLHEDPYVYNYLDRPVKKTLKIRNGLVIAVEIIYSMGSEQIAYEKGNKWSIISSDKSISACFERTIAIYDKRTFILT